MTVRIGVIGAGIMGSDHARTIARRVAGATLSAVADVDLPRAEQLARETGARALADPLELIAADDVDAVLVASHDSSHAELVLACIEAGIPVLCEKPLTLDADEARSIVEAERSSGRRLVSVGFSRRFDPALVEVRDELRAGAIGRPLLAHAVHRNLDAVAGDSATTIFSSAVHELDQTPWLLGSPLVEVTWVAPATTSLLPARQDPQLLLLRTGDGVLTTVEVFVRAVYGYDVRLEVVGETGTLALSPAPLVVRDAGLARSTAYPADWRPRYAAAYRAEVQAFVDGIATGEWSADLATASDGLRATLAAHATVEAMTSGRVTPIPAA